MDTQQLSQISSFVSAVLIIAGTYRIFEKAGEEGWKAIIPFYNKYTEYKLTWNTKMFWFSLLTGFMFVPSLLLFAACVAVGSVSAIVLSGLFMIACIVGIIAFQAQESIKLAKAFGKGRGFTVGLFFLEPIFKMILGFDDTNAYVK